MKAHRNPEKETLLRTKAKKALEDLQSFYLEAGWKGSARTVHVAITRLDFLKQL